MTGALDIRADRFQTLFGSARGGAHVTRAVTPKDIGPDGEQISVALPFRYGILRLYLPGDSYIIFSGEAEVNRVAVRLSGDFDCNPEPTLHLGVNRRFSMGVPGDRGRVSSSAQRKLREELTTVLAAWAQNNQPLFVEATRAANRREYEAALAEQELLRSRIAELQLTVDRLRAEALTDILA